MPHGTFCTIVNCMDGRTQLPVNTFMLKKTGADYADTITEPGPVRILCEPDNPLQKSIFDRLDISVEKHGSKTICIVAHADCAGNPVSDDTQLEQLKSATVALKNRYPESTIIPVWVDDDTWTVFPQ